MDSSVAAWLMREQGYRCEGTTMRLYRNADIGLSQFHTCCSQKDIDDASEVAFQLDIPYEVLDFTMDFRNQIIGKFIRTYESGGTPNPCIDCNRYMKFDKLLRFAEEKGLEYVATGHYALIEYDEVSGRYLLKKALDDSKDQSYVLYMLTQDQLSHIQFPLGGKMKKEAKRSRNSWASATPGSTTVRTFASFRTGTMSSLWNSIPENNTRQERFLIWRARRSADIAGLSVTPWGKEKDLVLPWVNLCTFAERIWLPIRSQWGRKTRCIAVCFLRKI